MMESMSDVNFLQRDISWKILWNWSKCRSETPSGAKIDLLKQKIFAALGPKGARVAQQILSSALAEN